MRCFHMENETTKYKLPKPGEEDFYDINQFNKAMDLVDGALSDLDEKKLDQNGDASNAVTEFKQEILRENLESGDKISKTHGKIKKWFSEMKAVAFSGRASDIEQDGVNRFVTDLEKKSWNSKVSASGGDISETKIESIDGIDTTFPVPVKGETSKVFFGKMKKFIEDFNDFKSGIITVGRLVNHGKTTEEGYALDARYGKTLFDMYRKLDGDLIFKGTTTNLDDVINEENINKIVMHLFSYDAIGNPTGMVGYSITHYYTANRVSQYLYEYSGRKLHRNRDDNTISDWISNLEIQYLADGTDINTLTETGKYRVFKGVNNPLDNSTDGDVLVITEKIWDGTVYQKVISLWSSRKTVERLFVMGNWQDMQNRNLDNKTNNSDNPLIFRGKITGDLNNLEIAPGYYRVETKDSITNGPANSNYCIFITFGQPHYVQLMIDTIGIKCRKKTGNPPRWGSWV